MYIISHFCPKFLMFAEIVVLTLLIRNDVSISFFTVLAKSAGFYALKILSFFVHL